MRGRMWVFIGIVVGVGVAVGRVPWLAGAGRSLADTAQHVVADGGGRLIGALARRGLPRRAVSGVTAIVALVVPGVAAVVLVVAAKATLRLRAVVGVATVALAGVAYVYQPKGVASGEVALGVAVAAAAVVLTGPLVAAPLSGLAALIGAGYLPRLLSSRPSLPAGAVTALHQSVTSHPDVTRSWQIVALVLATAPFALAARTALRR